MNREQSRDGWVSFGMGVVAVAAAVLSFSSLMGLAHLAGFSWWLAWLLPLSIDAYAVTATRVWLRTARTKDSRTSAKRNAYAAIVVSVSGNAAYHSLVAAGGPGAYGWVLALVVAAAAPVMLGLVAHLHAQLSKADAERSRPRDPAPALPAPKREPAQRRESGSNSRGRERTSEMREHAKRELAAGRKVTGADLDREFGTKDYGRKVLKELAASNGHR